MTTLRPRENTFKVDLSVFPKRPSFEEIHSFVHDTIGLRIDQVKRLQMNHVQNAAHVKCDTLKTAQDAVDQHNERHEIEVNKEEDVQMEAEDDPIVKDQSTQQTSEDGQPEDNVTDSATMFKVPALPSPPTPYKVVSPRPTNRPSDGSGFQGVKPKKPRGRPKKLKTKT
ncbi:hypothetical protein quinque_006478 [Culex quinquefasciatus]